MPNEGAEEHRSYSREAWPSSPRSGRDYSGTSRPAASAFACTRLIDTLWLSEKDRSRSAGRRTSLGTSRRYPWECRRSGTRWSQGSWAYLVAEGCSSPE